MFDEEQLFNEEIRQTKIKLKKFQDQIFNSFSELKDKFPEKIWKTFQDNFDDPRKKDIMFGKVDTSWPDELCTKHHQYEKDLRLVYNLNILKDLSDPEGPSIGFSLNNRYFFNSKDIISIDIDNMTLSVQGGVESVFYELTIHPQTKTLVFEIKENTEIKKIGIDETNPFNRTLETVFHCIKDNYKYEITDFNRKNFYYSVSKNILYFSWENELRKYETISSKYFYTLKKDKNGNLVSIKRPHQDFPKNLKNFKYASLDEIKNLAITLYGNGKSFKKKKNG